MDAVVRVNPRGLPALVDVAQRARDYVAHSKAPNTVKAYRSDWQHFAEWCLSNRLDSLPAEPSTVALYISDLAQVAKVSTIQRRIASISQAHAAAGHDSPTKDATVRAVWSGIRRLKGVAPDAKAPVLTGDIRRMVESMPPGILGIRDRALLLLGFAGAFRRSELVGLDVEDVQFTTDGLVVTLRRSKTDQEGEGRRIGVPYGSNPDTCPVRALNGWLAASAISSGPLFAPVSSHGALMPGRLSDKGVARLVKRCAAAAGLDPSRYSGHSLRAGLATSAAAAGASERSIMAQTGHRSTTMVRRYIRDGSLFRENAAAAVGL